MIAKGTLILTRLTRTIIDNQFNSTRNKVLDLNSNASDLIYTLDLGNTHPHFGKFIQGKLTSVAPITEEAGIDQFLRHKNNWVASNVTQFNIPIENQLSNLRTESQFLEMNIQYGETLGEDRLFQSYFLHHNFPEEEILFIDAGTFITIDLISKEGFEGGFIFPGINAFLSSYSKGQKLPKTWDAPLNLTASVPHTTQEAITEALKVYLHSTLSYFLNKYSKRSIVVTGGTGEFISNEFSLENYYPHLIHDSLFHLNFCK